MKSKSKEEKLQSLEILNCREQKKIGENRKRKDCIQEMKFF